MASSANLTDTAITVLPSTEEIAPNPNSSAVSAANALSGRLLSSGKPRAAKIALTRALSVDPSNFQLWANLSSVMWALRAYEDALTCAKRAIQFCPNQHDSRLTSAYLALGNASMSLGEFSQAEEAYSWVAGSAPLFEGEVDERRVEDARWNRCLLRLMQGDYIRAWPDYHLRIDRTKPRHLRDPEKGSPRWQGESLAGKSLLILHDQGYGDTIMYSRFLNHQVFDLCDEMHAFLPPELVPLFWKLLELQNITPVYPGAGLPKVDYHVYLGSIPSIVGTTLSSVPTIPSAIRNHVLGEVVREHGTKIMIPQTTPHLKVGVCWSGREDFSGNDVRRVPFRLLMSLAEHPQIWPYSLQVGPPAEELRKEGAELFVSDLESQLIEGGWLATASAIMQMDVVVTCCTAMAHLACTLGVPTLVMLSTEPYWVWGHEGDSTPWYPSAKLFRQQRDRRGDWTVVVEGVRDHLLGLLEQLNAEKGE